MSASMRPLCAKAVHRNRGFTLIEVLIAIMITALIGLGSWQILNSAIRASDMTQQKIEQLGRLQRAMIIIARDLQQVVPRSIRDQYGDYQPALTNKNDFYVLEFSRIGWRNPLEDPRSDLQRVAYELDQDVLIRHYWSVLDRSQDSDPVSRTLLKEVESLSFRFLNESSAWLDNWPSTKNSQSTDRLFKKNELPRAIKMSLKHTHFGEISKLFELPQYLGHQNFPGSGSAGTGTGTGPNK